MRISGDDYIGRVFAVLSLISKAPEPLSLDSVTESASLPKPTVFRLLKSLANLGYIQNDPNNTGYRVTSKVLELLPGDEDGWLKDRAQPLLEQVHAELNETVNLGRLDGLRLRYLSIIESTQPLRWIPEEKLHEELLQTGLGRAIAAHLPLEKTETLLPDLCQRAGYSDIDAMRKKFKTIRRSGWAVEKNQSCEGVSCYAVPLFDEKHEVVAAVSVSVPNVRIESGGNEAIIRSLTQLDNRING